MSYSKVSDKPLKLKRRSEFPTIDGGGVVQELGFIETKTYRYYWITTDELQAVIADLEAEAEDGWVIVNEPARTPIAEPLDLYNVQITMRRHVAE